MDPTGGSSGGSSVEQANVSAVMSTTPELVEDEIAESPDQTSISGGDAMGTSIDAAIQPITFFRKIRSVTRNFEFAFSDTDSTGKPTTVVVTIRKRLMGSFNILERSVPDTVPPPSAAGLPIPPRTGLPDTTIHLVSKPLDDLWVRRLLLKRVKISDRGREGEDDDNTIWRFVATSGVKVTSQGATTAISSLHIQTAALDTTITDPLAFFRLRRILKLTSGEMVTLTATTGRNDDVVVLNYRALRVRFHNNGDNTYTAQVRAGWLAGVHHFGVNALSHGTLFDDAAPYDSQAWILPYVVQPTELADFMP